MLEISKLKFGSPAAERDSDLIDCFVNSETYQNLKLGKKTIILGNRGSGKSALFRKLAEEKSKKNIIIQLAPEDYSYELMSGILKKEMVRAIATRNGFLPSAHFLKCFIFLLSSFIVTILFHLFPRN